jgi:hypothetical protein
MKRWCVPAICAGLLFAACGDDKPAPGDTGASEDAGGSALGDGGLDGDAAAEADDTDASCGGERTSGSGGADGCTAEQTYSCGANAYEIVCSCPAATCTCTKNGAVVGTANWTGCGDGPGMSCDISFGGVAEQCGIPSGGNGTMPPPPQD